VASSQRPAVTVGFFSIGLAAYWPQFPGLRERLDGYGRFVAERLREAGADVVDVGMVDTQAGALAAGDRFRRADVDLVVCFVTTYATSSQVLPAVQHVGRPVLILNLQPTAQLDYRRTGTGEWLANCQACCVPEIACAFERCGIDFHTVTGLLGLPTPTEGALANEATATHPAAERAWREVHEWIDAVAVQRTLRRTRVGFLGHTYPGMLDMYSDFTQVSGTFGTHVEVLEMEDLEACVEAVTGEEVERKAAELRDFFVLAEANPNDPISLPPDPRSFDWSCRVAAGLDRLVDRFQLQALSYYYRGAEGKPYAALSAGMIPGLSLLTARGIPCSGEGDLKNCVAMKAMDVLGAGGSFTELYAMDFAESFILMGHDGPFHLRIAAGKPVLRQLGTYHGKVGSGLSVEATVQHGPITILGITQRRDGKMKMLVADGWCLPGDTLRIGNTNSRLRFTEKPDEAFDVADWMNRWAAEGPTHHVALGLGHRAAAFEKFAKLIDVPVVRR
jgi:L-arabinose isomerase